VGVRGNHAGVNREAFAPHQPLRHAAYDYGLKHLPQQIAIPEPAMTVLGEGRMVGDIRVQA
jgi:hypothetical protein